jgi:putative ABC transport system permease protein
MDRVTALMAKTYPDDKNSGASVEPLKNDFFPKEQRKIFWLLLGAVGFVLLIACVNIANLLLANGMTMQKEIAVRVALGASRRAIFVQQLIEGVMLALAGGLLGLGVGYGMLRATTSLIPPNTFPAEADLRLNLPILLIMFVVTTLAGLLFSSIPAWYASRVSPGEALKEGGRSGTGAGRHRLRRGLVIGEFALALPLLAGAGLAIHSFWNLERVDLGVRTDHVLTFGFQVPDARPKDPDRVLAYYRQILDRIKSVPGVTHAALTTGMPMRGGFGASFSIAGKPASTDPSQRTFALLRMVSPEYFQTFGIRLISGRTISDQDIGSGVKVALVNEELVNKFLKGSDPLQQRLVTGQPDPVLEKPGPPVEWQIIGVFHNVKGFGFREEFPEIVVPFAQSPWPSANFGVLTSGDPNLMTKTIAAAVHGIDPDIALAEPRTMEQIRSELLVNDSFMAILFGSFAVIALLLAGVGIYGVMAFSVAQRSHEIAVRMALGSSRNRVVSLVVREGLWLAGIGLVLGLVGAYFVGRSMQSTLFGVKAMDFSAFGAVGFILLVTGMLACFVPARRAASVQPMQALRTE